MPLAVNFLERDFDEVLASQSVMLERRGRPQPKLVPQRMRDLLESQLVTTRHWLDARKDTVALDIQHAQLIAAPIAVAERIARFLEPLRAKQLDLQAMAARVDASLYRPRK
jgi:hypothetical protein